MTHDPFSGSRDPAAFEPGFVPVKDGRIVDEETARRAQLEGIGIDLSPSAETGRLLDPTQETFTEKLRRSRGVGFVESTVNKAGPPGVEGALPGGPSPSFTESGQQAAESVEGTVMNLDVPSPPGGGLGVGAILVALVAGLIALNAFAKGAGRGVTS